MSLQCLYFPRYGPVTGCNTLLDISQDHPDMVGVHVDTDRHVSTVPEINVVPRARTRLVLAIQSTENMMEHIKWINKASQAMIRYDMADNSEIGVVTFNNITKMEHEIVTLDDETTREKVADTVPGKYQLVDHNVTCITCMLDHLVTRVLHNNTEGVHIVIVATAGEQLHSVLDTVHQAKLSFIILPRDQTTRVTDVSEYDDVASQTGGDTFLVSQTQHEMDMYYDILSSLHRTLGGDDKISSSSIQTQHHYGHQKMSQGTFYTSNEDVMFRVYVPDTEDHMIKSVTFQSLDTGRVFGPYSKMSASYDLINFKTPNIVGDQPWSHGDRDGKKHWNYTVEWFHGSKDTKSIIDITSASRTGSMKLKSWVSGIDSWTCENDFQHVKISATLMPGHLSGVELTARVTLLTDNGTVETLPDMKMVPHGNIYSTVMLSYPSTGRYTITVKAEDMITGEVHVDTHEHVVRLTHVPTRDCVPPGQVTDLSIAIYNTSDVVTAQWTSPAGDLDIAGHVDTFKLVASEHVCDLLTHVSSGDTVLSVQTRAARGEVVEQVLQWTRYDTLYYVAVVGVDTSGNIGHVSNIVTVYVPQPISETDLQSAVSLSQSESILDNYQSIIIISSSLGGVLMICLLCIVYIIISGRYRSQTKSSLRTSTPDYTIDQSRSEGVTDVQQILARERQHCQQVTASLPVYWSCDQILARTDAEKPDTNLHNYYNCQGDQQQKHVSARGYHGDVSPHSRYSCSSDSYTDTVTNTDTDSFRCYNTGGHVPDTCYNTAGHVTHSSLATTATDVTDEGYDSASRELELINSRKLYTIV